jgi:hypothetical protein
MNRVLKALYEEKARIDRCGLYAWLKDDSVPALDRMAFAPDVAYFSMSFGDLMTTVMPRPAPDSQADRMVNAHCSEDDHHWRWYLEDIRGLGYDDHSFTQTCETLWSPATTPTRHLIYSVVGWANRTSDPVGHLILIEALEAGLSGFFEFCYRNVAAPHLPFLKYFGQTHYDAEYKHSVTSWFQVTDSTLVDHPLAALPLTPETEAFALAAIDDIFDRFQAMYDGWLTTARSNPVRTGAVQVSAEPALAVLA